MNIKSIWPHPMSVEGVECTDVSPSQGKATQSPNEHNVTKGFSSTTHTLASIILTITPHKTQ